MPKTRSLEEAKGAVHADLLGNDEFPRFRPRRLHSSDLNFGLSCQGTLEGKQVGPFPVIDISPTGLALGLDKEISIPPGTLVQELALLYRDSVVWEGQATSIYHVEGQQARAGLRFSSGLLDLHLIEVADSLETRIEQSLEERRQVDRHLSPEWRASVATLRSLLEDVREVLDRAEKSLPPTSPTFEVDRRSLFDRIFDKWSEAFYAQQEKLFYESAEIDKSQRERAQSYASREILPLVYSSPMFQRAYDKPLGYAGDYRLIEMYFAESYSGESLYSQFLQYSAQRFPLGRTVCAREGLLRGVVSDTIVRSENSRIVSLACGPAVELQNLLDDFPEGKHSCEFVFVDQDEGAMHFAYNALSRALLSVEPERATGIQLNGMHVSVKQVLSPGDESEIAVIRAALGGANLIYAAGLYDYLPEPVAAALTQNLWALLRPGGRLFVGNLKVCPISTWLMEYVLSWHLQYRTEEDMKNLAGVLNPAPERYQVTADETGRCIFLDARKPS